MKRFIFGVLPVIFCLVASGAGAQESLRIAAVVNDEMISVYDLNMRLNMVLLFSGLPDSPDTRKRFAPQVLRTMIDDELKRQEASRLKIPVKESEIERALKQFEKRNGMRKGGLDEALSRKGVKKAALASQIEADIGWRKLINGRFGRTTRVSDEEIDEVLSEIKKNQGQSEYLISEIFLPVDKPEAEAEVLALANRLVSQSQSLQNFRALARNFSKSPTAEKGGQLGWNRVGQLGGNLDKALPQLSPGQISQPIRTLDGFYILFLESLRTAKGLSGGDEGSPVVNLQQLFLSLDKNATPAQVATTMENAKRLGKKANNCQELDVIGKDISPELSGNLGNIKISALAPQQRNMVRGLPVLKASQPLRTANGVTILMVCKRTEPKKTELSLEAERERIADRLIGERLSLSARQYLRDLRRSAFVDIRL
ncbi:MAG: peptidylprolyl isomerase [Proteobacteria bacterium]|nr:peptidylprolyl isomerase [Pseudomonadota bacterium]MDA1024171.1 peptidylprolyl isomerase [Pseudomonadota bacterium]